MIKKNGKQCKKHSKNNYCYIHDPSNKNKILSNLKYARKCRLKKSEKDDIKNLYTEIACYKMEIAFIKEKYDKLYKITIDISNKLDYYVKSRRKSWFI